MRKAYAPMMRRAQSLLSDPDEANDLVQQVCIHLWEHPAGLDRADNPIAYCLKAVYNSAASRLRTSRYFEPLEAADSEQSAEFSVDEVDYIHSLLAHIPPMQRQAFLLRMEDDLEYEEIAVRMNIKQDYVRQLISRARKKLRELYGKDN
ncbi:MAG: sigma-70 family RNA polymerase sigma factor [Prevotella sp.]|nr:sigma-70 family RNA polymerase sigma factor [Prevotella sp.]MCM1074233.1 sigma-70 family RNA polymerase sigma factor [Ruminococcus sp.]